MKYIYTCQRVFVLCLHRVKIMFNLCFHLDDLASATALLFLSFSKK